MDILYVCFNNASGYAFAARNYINALKSKYDIGISPLDNMKLMKEVDPENYEEFVFFSKKKMTENTKILYHCIPPMQRRVKAKGHKTIGFAIYEGRTAPKFWLTHLKTNTRVITASHFNFEVFSELNPFIIPHCLDLEIYSPDAPKWKDFKKFTYLFVGTWKYRKGVDKLLQVWKEYFSHDSSVQLLLKTDVKQATSYLQQLFAGSVCDNVSVVAERFTDRQMAGFIRSADCLVLPTLGEGFACPPVQAMAVKVPVIVTNYSGVTEYADNDTAFLIEPEGFVEIKNLDSYVQFQDSKWPFISIPGIAEQMRRVRENPQEAEKKTEFARKIIETRFSYEEIRRKFDILLEDF